MDFQELNNPDFQEVEEIAAEGSAIGHKSALAPPRFRSQWNPGDQVFFEHNDLPSCTIPDQSMTISEIIARFTRSGVMPVQVFNDDGGNEAPDDPEFDPLDFDPEYMKAEVDRLRKQLEDLQVPAQEPGVEENPNKLDKNASPEI